MKFIFRVDSSVEIGFGHASRCLALAKELLNLGYEVAFVYSEMSVFFCTQLIEWGIPSFEVSSELEEYEDAHATCKVFDSDDQVVVILDSYQLGNEWESVCQRLKTKLVVFADQLSDHHDCDILIDSNLTARKEQDWRPLTSKSASLLIGPQFACLRQSIRKIRDVRESKQASDGRVLVYFGNSIDLEILRDLVPLLKTDKYQFDVVLPLVSKDNLRSFEAPPNVRLVPSGESFDGLLQHAAYAVGAGGVSALERACIGIPQIVFITADNQTSGSLELASRGLCVLAGHLVDKSPEVIVEILTSALDEFERAPSPVRSEVAVSAVDGLGAIRVALLLCQGVQSRINIRPANYKDSTTYFRWVNDPDVRDNSFHQPSIDCASHEKWFEEMLRNPDVLMFVAHVGDLPIGQVRLNVVGESAFLDYSVDRDFRGLGVAQTMLEKVFSIAGERIDLIVAAVLLSNYRSIQTLGRLGFEIMSRHERSVDYVLHL